MTHESENSHAPDTWNIRPQKVHKKIHDKQDELAKAGKHERTCSDIDDYVCLYASKSIVSQCDG